MSADLGLILSVDLTTPKIESNPADETVLQKFIGGSGYGAFLMAQYLPHPPDPFDPISPLIFAAGPLTGTPVPTSGRHTIIARSPLTGLWGEASAGGTPKDLPPLNIMLSDYYELRKWDEIGIPLPEKVDELGLSEWAMQD